MKKNKKKIFKKKRKKITNKKKGFKPKPRRKKYSYKKKKKNKRSAKRKKINLKSFVAQNKRKKDLIYNLVKFQEKFKFNFKIKINFSLDKKIKSFFDKIESKISKYKVLRAEEKRRIKLEEQEKLQKQKVELEKQKKEDEKLKIKLKEKALKEEIKLEKERSRDIKLFLRQEQAIVRKEQAEKQRQFLQQLKLDKQIEKFRIRELKELEKLERISLREKREDYSGLQDRIDKLKENYRIIRDQKIRERVEALGVEIQEGDDRETLLRKEKEYTIARQRIELSLESFYRSASSLVFQLNKRHITRHMSIFRCVDRRFETGEIFIKWDETSDDDWLILIYIKDNSPDQGIVIEDKSNPEKNLSYEFKPSEIFKASDLMVDSLTQLLARERSKKESN